MNISGVFLFCFAIVGSFSVAFGQKGVDTQTQTIREASTKGTQIDSPPSKAYDFGKDKTKTRKRLDNPYRMSARRDILIKQILEILDEKKFILDESASRTNDGVVVTQPLVFSRGAVVTKNELGRYAVVANTDSAWTSARYSLRIEVRSIDGIRNEVSVTADIEGKSLDGFTTVWRNLESSGLAEEEFLVKLVEMVTGASPDDPRNE